MSNLSEEERKKAYEFLQELEKNGYRYTADGREMYIVENVFNKIDRLQKENEFLKAPFEYANGNTLDKRYVEMNFISKDKIKAEIKEYEERQKNTSDVNHIIICQHIINVLKELLKGE